MSAEARFGAAAYWIFTTRHDEVMDGTQVIHGNDEHFAPLRRVVDGLVSEVPPDARRFCLTSLEQVRDELGSDVAASTLVTIAISLGASARGPGCEKRTAAVAMHVEDLEKAGFRVQVLGYTTRSWAGGQSHQDWLSDGSPPMPGRLCDLRHLVMKPVDMAFDDPACAIVLGASMSILKENVTGEGLAWAAETALTQGHARNVLLSIEDKHLSVDARTLKVNPEVDGAPNLLDAHRASVLKNIAGDGRFSLVSAGLGIHDGSEYRFVVDAIERHDYATAFTATQTQSVVEYLDALTCSTIWGLRFAPTIKNEIEPVHVVDPRPAGP